MFASGFALGLAIGSAKTSTVGWTTGQIVTTGILAGGMMGTAAGLVAVDSMKRDSVLYDKTGSAVRFAAGALLFSPILAAEDVARRMGADIPKEGFFCNSEGKSIWEIWNESKPLTRAEKQLLNQIV